MPEITYEEKVVDNSIDGDFLNRQEFIQQVKSVIGLLADNKKNSCFAISGSWGVGKSFVLEKIEKQLLFEADERTTLDKYFVFHFNCWEYDYYGEPLIAIVSAMLDEINSQTYLFSENAREHIFSAAKFVLSQLYEGGAKWLETKIGINPQKITDGLSEIHTAASSKIEDDHQYDSFFAFKQALSTLREEIKKIVLERTVIFVVDELDRCLPEYQIKVLERIHHIFNGIDNIQVILAVDKAQLERTVQKMFGEHVDTQKYLAKFIKFEIELDEGTYNSQFEENFGYYFNQFEEINNLDFAEFLENIFNGIAVREKIEIIEKCHLLHNLLQIDGEKKQAIFMCIELLLTIIKHIHAEIPIRTYGISFSNMFGRNSTSGLKYLEEKMSREAKGFYGAEGKVYYITDGSKSYIRPSDIWGILLGCYATITESKFDGYVNNPSIMSEAEDYSKQFWGLLKTIK